MHTHAHIVVCLSCILCCVMLSAVRNIPCLPCYQRALHDWLTWVGVCLCVSSCSSVAVQYIRVCTHVSDLTLYLGMRWSRNGEMRGRVRFIYTCMFLYQRWRFSSDARSVACVCASDPIVGQITMLSKTIPSPWWSLWHHLANIKTRCGATCDLADQRTLKSYLLPHMRAHPHTHTSSILIWDSYLSCSVIFWRLVRFFPTLFCPTCTFIVQC